MIWGFSTREFATGLWLLVFLGWAFTHPPVRRSAWQVVKAFVTPKVFLPVVAVAGYTALVVWAFELVGLWEPALLKDTILWFVLAGGVSVFSAMAGKEDESLFRLLVAENIKVLVFIEFLVNLYTFSLLAELVLVPTLALVGVMDAVAERDPAHEQVSRFLKSVQSLVGLAIFYFAVSTAVHDLRVLGTTDTWIQVSLPVILSLGLIPAAFLLRLYSSYEQLLIRFRMGPAKDPSLIRYAKAQLIRHVRFRPRVARRFLGKHALDLIRIRSKEDVDALFAEETETPLD